MVSFKGLFVWGSWAAAGAAVWSAYGPKAGIAYFILYGLAAARFA